MRRLPKIASRSEATPTTIFIDQGRPSQKPMPATSAGVSLSPSFCRKTVATPVIALAPKAK